MMKRFFTVMVLCFIFGGYFILSYVSQLHSAYTIDSLSERVRRNFTDMHFRNWSETFDPPAGGMRIARMFSPESVVSPLAGIMFMVAGISMWFLVREKETHHIRDVVIDTFLLPEDKQIVEMLKKMSGVATQKELSLKTGMTRVRVHRVLKRLESKSIVKSHPYGATNKIVLTGKFGKPTGTEKNKTPTG